MTTRLSLASVLGLIALGACAQKPFAPLAPSALDPLAKPLPTDPAVRTGVLDNGLTWSVETNSFPEKRAVLRLAVDAGSVLEDDDQLGLAHFVEHMAFNGTEHFPGNELIAYLESVGTQFGPHLNAHTSFEETVYKLTVPTDDPEVFENGLLVLADWAGGLSFAPDEIDKERGVVLEEWRTRLGPGERVSEVTLPQTFWGSPYPDRLPIGTEESLRTFEHDAARRFYRDWYRPDLMAVVAVGDFDPDQVQRWIEEKFSGLRGPTDPRPRPEFELPAHEAPLRAVIADPEARGTSVRIAAKQDWPEDRTYGEYRDTLITGIGLSMFNERLAAIAQAPDAPFLGAGVGTVRLNPTEGAWSLGARTADGQALAGYEAVLTELARAKRHGFREEELSRAKTATLHRYERMLAERDKTTSVQEANELVRAFLNQEPIPGLDVEAQLAQREVPGLTRQTMADWAQRWFPEASRTVHVVMPHKEELTPPTEAELAAVEARVAAATIAPLGAEEAVGELLAAPPHPGNIARTDAAHPELGFTRWTLSNGVTVWHRATDFKQDEIRFTGWADGGLAGIADDDYISATLATTLAARSGFGDHDALTLAKWRTGHAAQVSQVIGADRRTVGGSSSVDDLERALQLLYAGFTAPRFDGEALQTLRKQRQESLRNRDKDPNSRFSDAYTALVWPHDPRRQPWTVETLDQLELGRARAAYTTHLTDATGWTFVFIGNLPEDFEELVRTYVASLPANGASLSAIDRGMRPKPGRLAATVAHGIADKSRVTITYRGDFPDNTWEDRNRLYGMVSVLRVMLREELREELGGVYGVSVSGRESDRPYDHYQVGIGFGCDPERTDELIAATDRVVASLREDGPAPELVAQVQEQNRRARELSLVDNGFWLSAFTGALQRGADPAELLTWDARNDALSAIGLRDTARALLDEDERIQVVLLPANAE